MILKNGDRIDGCSDTVPIGTLNPYLGSTPPFGYLICEGQLISKTLYPELYAICGNTFGTATETHFYLPDLRGRTIAGYQAGDSDFGTLGGLIGSKYIQEHYHAYKFGTSAGGDGSGLVYSSTTGTQPNKTAITDVKGVTAGNSGNIQPTAVLNWIVKATMLLPNYSKVSGAQANSSTDVYSCNYVNNVSIVDYGNSGNNYYIKYGNGVMVCYGKFTPTVAINSTWGSLYASTKITGPTFPVVFTRLDSIVYNVLKGPTVWIGTAEIGTTMPTSTGPQLYLISGATQSSTSYLISYVAYGTWK